MPLRRALLSMAAGLTSAATRTGAGAARAGQYGRARQYGSGGGHGSGGVTYEGVTLHEPGKTYVALAHGMGGVMWFWIFYRCYHDGRAVFWEGHEAHWMHDIIEQEKKKLEEAKA